MDRDQERRDRERKRPPGKPGPERGAGRKPPAKRASSKGNLDIEASGTDGKGTGRTGEDAGGYGPIPGSEGGV